MFQFLDPQFASRDTAHADGVRLWRQETPLTTDGLHSVADKTALAKSDGRFLMRCDLRAPLNVILDVAPSMESGTSQRLLFQKCTTCTLGRVGVLSASARLKAIEKGSEVGFFRCLTRLIKISQFVKTLDKAFEFPLHTFFTLAALHRAGTSRT